MKYALLIYEPEDAYGAADSAAMQAIIAEHNAFVGTLGDRFLWGAGLVGAEAATTVRSGDGARTVHDGPFAEAREQLGGLYVIDVADLDEAIGWARQLPLAPGGSVEVRPLLPGG